MKKLFLALATILTLCFSAYFVSCKKESDPPPQELPAIQKIRDAAVKDWNILDKTLLELSVVFEQKLKSEFVNYETDSTVMVTCRIKFKDDEEEHLLPYAQKFLGGTKYYFYTLSGGKPKILFHNTAIADFNVSGTGSAAPIEQISFNFTKIDFE